MEIIKELEAEDFPVYMVMRRKKGKNNKWEDTESPAYRDYDEAVMFLEASRNLYPEYLYRIDEY